VNGSRLRRLFTRVAAIGFVLGVSVVLALLLGEAAVRFAAPQQLIQIRPDLWQAADSIGWMRRPNASTQINTGERTVSVFTDRERHRVGSQGRTEAATQVLLMGDSFMEALQVNHEQTVAHLLEGMLSQGLGRPVAVRNAGVAGWNPNHYLIRTRQLLSRDTFALVIVAVFVGNDAVAYRFDRVAPRAPAARRHFRLPRGFGRNEFVQSFLAPVNDALETRSHLYILAKNQFSTLRMRLGITADYLPLEYRRSEAASKRWSNTTAIVKDISRVAAAHGTPVLFVLTPERFQVYADEFQRYLRGFGIDSSLVDVDQPSRMLLQGFQAEGLHVVGALSAMRAEAAKGGPRLYGTVDQHLSPDGHRVVAAVTAPEALRLMRPRQRTR
jgi:acetyltransferase AlgX (SGNH hydrolase-like protein)